MAQDAVVNGSSVVECSFLYDYELEWGRWYRSKDRKGGQNPFPSYLMNKKWTMEEEFTKHMLHLQQVILSSNNFSRLNFDIPVWIDSH